MVINLLAVKCYNFHVESVFDDFDDLKFNVMLVGDSLFTFLVMKFLLHNKENCLCPHHINNKT